VDVDINGEHCWEADISMITLTFRSNEQADTTAKRHCHQSSYDGEFPRKSN
jgi:hypothetical protein